MLFVRPAVDADAAAISRVHVTAWRAAYAGIVPDEVLDRLDCGDRTAQWTQQLTSAATRTLVAELHGGIVGFVSFAATRDNDDDPAKVGEIRAMYVAPHLWGQGIGENLGAAAIEDLFDEEFEYVTLWVLAKNSRARRFYERLGFEREGAAKEATIGVPLEVLRYRRRIREFTIRGCSPSCHAR